MDLEVLEGLLKRLKLGQRSMRPEARGERREARSEKLQARWHMMEVGTGRE